MTHPPDSSPRVPGSLGQRIRQARLELAARRGQPISQRQIGRALGLSGVTVGSWEADEKEPSLARLVKLAAELEVAPEWLAFGRSGRRYGQLPTIHEIREFERIRLTNLFAAGTRRMAELAGERGPGVEVEIAQSAADLMAGFDEATAAATDEASLRRAIVDFVAMRRNEISAAIDTAYVSVDAEHRKRRA